jgi:hypothetical protein
MNLIKRVLIALRLSKMNRSAKVNQGNATAAAIVNHPEFFPSTESGPIVDAINDATSDLSTADAATVSGGHESFAAAETAENNWDFAMRKTAAYVQQKADDQPEDAAEIILAAALKMKKVPVKTTTKPLPVEDVMAELTGLGNAIKLTIVSDNRYGVRYEVMMTRTPDVESSWVSVADTTARKIMVEGLLNGERYYFKTRAVNNIGKSIYSGVVSQLAA